MGELVHVGRVGPDHRPLCERCDRESRRRLRLLTYDDDSHEIVCPDCMTPDEDEAERVSSDKRASERLTYLSMMRDVPGDGPEAQSVRRTATEEFAGLSDDLARQLPFRPIRGLPSEVPAGCRLMHSDVREYWEPPGIDGYLAHLVEDRFEIELVVCGCDWAPGLIHYRVKGA
jgi:hypothetical protein